MPKDRKSGRWGEDRVATEIMISGVNNRRDESGGNREGSKSNDSEGNKREQAREGESSEGGKNVRRARKGYGMVREEERRRTDMRHEPIQILLALVRDGKTVIFEQLLRRDACM